MEKISFRDANSSKKQRPVSALLARSISLCMYVHNRRNSQWTVDDADPMQRFEKETGITQYRQGE